MLLRIYEQVFVHAFTSVCTRTCLSSGSIFSSNTICLAQSFDNTPSSKDLEVYVQFCNMLPQYLDVSVPLRILCTFKMRPPKVTQYTHTSFLYM